MTNRPFDFDEVGYWSVLKLDIIEQYGAAYTKAFAGSPSLKKYYVDGFSGAGMVIVKSTREQIEGSPTRALKISPPFDHFYFIDLNADKTAYLKQMCANRGDVSIHTGDTNPYLKALLPTIRYKDYKRALCLLDPYGLQLDWDVIALAGQSKAVDLFLNFPVMDMNRNAIWRHPEKVPKKGIERMNRFWGDESWRQVAYAESPQGSFFSAPELLKQSNEIIVEAFRKRLNDVAGFSFVPAPLPMKNSNNAVVYYLFLASPKKVAAKIVKDIFNKYR